MWKVNVDDDEDGKNLFSSLKIDETIEEDSDEEFYGN